MTQPLWSKSKFDEAASRPCAGSDVRSGQIRLWGGSEHRTSVLGWAVLVASRCTGPGFFRKEGIKA